MKWSELFTSSIGKKFVMALTGLFLISFLVIHVGLNSCIFADVFNDNDNGSMFNRAAHFMGAALVIRIIEIGLFAIFLVHIIQGYVLEAKNLSRRSKGYAINLGSRGSPWYRRSMGLLGTLLFMFLIMHIYHFWTPSRLGGIGNIQKLEEVEYYGRTYHNLYAQMLVVFENPIVVILYVVACISLAFHLIHGFQSAFRTLGVHNSRHIGLINGFGIFFSVVISVLFALMPVSMYLGWVD